MVGSLHRLAAAAAFSAMLAGCASSPDLDRPVYDDAGVAAPETPLQCVPYARDRSRIAIYGDASTWWEQAAGRYGRSNQPAEGSVMVLFNYAGPERGHLAVVSRIVDARDIRVDHANWLDDGQIYVNDPVRDVSPENDWSAVRVFNIRTGAWGAKIYPVQGFISPGPDTSTMRLAQTPPPASRPDDAIARLLNSDQGSDQADDPDSDDGDN